MEPQIIRKRARGRPTVLTDEERKLRRRTLKKNYNRCIVNVGYAIERWTKLKQSKGFESNAEMAHYLLSIAELDTRGPQQSKLNHLEEDEYVEVCDEVEDSRQVPEILPTASASTRSTQDKYIKAGGDDTDTASENGMEEENLQIKCEPVVDDGAQQSNVVIGQPGKQANSANLNRERIIYTARGSTSDQEVEFQSIHGLPVDVPFNLQYLSPCARKTLKSKMYIIVEQRVLSYTPVTSVNIKVQGDICEHVSDTTSCFMKDINNQKMSSWVDIKNIIRKVVVNTHTGLSQSTNKLEKNMKTSQISSASKIEKLHQTPKNKNRNQTMNTGLVMDTDEVEIKVDVDESQDSFDVSNSFDLPNVQDSFGVSNMPDSFGVSNEPIYIKQEVQDLDHELIQESLNIGTNMGDIDVVGGILDGMIANVDEQCQANLDSLPKSNVNKVTSKRTSDEMSYNVYEKRKKLLKVEESSSCQGERQSSRLRSKGFRIDYGQLNDLNDLSDVSDLDYIFSDSEEPEDEDPDFYLCEESKDDGNVEENLDLNVEEDNEKSEAKPSLTPEEIRAIARQKYAEKQMLKRIKLEKKRIKVKLCEHTDKYTVEEIVSFRMKDRGKEDSEKTTKMLVCTQCKKFRTENEEQLEQHIEQHLNGELTCKKCNFHACYSREMAKHKKDHHKVQFRRRQCPLCGIHCEDDKNLKKHILSIHNLSRYVCEVCLKADKQVSFKSVDKKQEHFLEHHKDIMFQCSDCEKYFRKRASLTKHLCSLNALDATKAPCEICGKVMRKDSIPLHKQTVHFNVRRNKCPHCSYSANLPCKLKKHIEARHEGVHTYQCDQCTFSCVRHSQLVSHKRTHTGDKPYKCDECPYAAAWNVQLKDHKKLHSNPLGVECKICGVVVKRGAAYTKHMKKDHDDASADDQ